MLRPFSPGQPLFSKTWEYNYDCSSILSRDQHWNGITIFLRIWLIRHTLCEVFSSIFRLQTNGHCFSLTLTHCSRRCRATITIYDLIRQSMHWYSYLHLVVAMHALIVGYRLGVFLDSLYDDPPINMNTLCTCTTKYINIEENSNARRKKSEGSIHN